MRLTELVSVDSRGRVIIPLTVRSALNLTENMRMMLVADLENREITLKPFADPDAKLIEMRMRLKDAPGALAKVATVLATYNVDLLSTQSRTIRRGENAEWHTIADISKCRCKLSELKTKIISEGYAEGVEIKVLE